MRHAAIPGAFAFLCGATFLPASAGELKVGTYITTSQSGVQLETATERGRVMYPSRETSRSGFEVRYGNYGVAVSAPFHGFDRGVPRLLPSSGWGGFRTFYHGNAWGADVHHQATRGFTAHSETPGAPGAFFPDMTLRSTGVKFYRAMEPGSRVSSLSNGLAEQGGSADLFWMLGASRNRLRNDSPLLRQWGAGKSVFHETSRLDTYSVFAGAGFALSTNVLGFYFDPALFAGYGAQVRAWDGEYEAAWNLVKVNLRMRTGFRTPWFDVGAGFENDTHTVPTGREGVVFHTLIAKAQVEVFL